MARRKYTWLAFDPLSRTSVDGVAEGGNSYTEEQAERDIRSQLRKKYPQISLTASITIDEVPGPRHCGRTANSAGDGIWECPKCDAYSMPPGAGERRVWQASRA